MDGSSLCANSSYNAFVNDNGYSYFDWTVSGGTITSGQGTTEIRYTTSSPGSSFYITCHVKDGCGNWIPQSPIEYGSITDCGPGGSYDFIIAYYPNPSDNSMTISNSSTNTATTSTNTKQPFNYKIYNKTGKVLKQGSSIGEDAIVDTPDLASGNYFLHIFVGKQEIQKQIIIKH